MKGGREAQGRGGDGGQQVWRGGEKGEGGMARHSLKGDLAFSSKCKSGRDASPDSVTA